MERVLDRLILYAAQNASDSICFDGTQGLSLEAYCDSDWATSHATTGFALMLCGAAILHVSRRQHCIALSSTEAEIMAASEAAAETVYVRRMLRELGVDMDEPTVIHVDNSGAVELAKDRKSCHRSRHVLRRYFFVREAMAHGEVNVVKIDTKLNISDILTKAGFDAPTFDTFKGQLMGSAHRPPSAQASGTPSPNALRSGLLQARLDAMRMCPSLFAH